MDCPQLEAKKNFHRHVGAVLQKYKTLGKHFQSE